MRIAPISPVIRNNNFKVNQLNSLITFGYQKRTVKSGDLSSYDSFVKEHPGAQVPQVEAHKYQLSLKVEEAIKEENYLEAIKTKIKIAQICKEQGHEKDAYILEEGIRELYVALPKYQKEDAKKEIAEYNLLMAEYIEEDIAKRTAFMD